MVEDIWLGKKVIMKVARFKESKITKVVMTADLCKIEG